MKALIDGDIIVYASGFASDTRMYEVPTKDGGVSFPKKKEAKDWCYKNGYDPTDIEVVVTSEPVEYALHTAKKMLLSIMEESGADEKEIYLTGSNNFRKLVCEEYKANRKDAIVPTHKDAIRDYLIDKWEAVVVEGMEADDALGIYQEEEDTIICTIDKDLDQIPGWHYNWRSHTVYHVTDAEAHRSLWKQMLIGDTVDNITGIKGIGKVKAGKLLDSHYDPLHMSDIVLKKYEAAGRKDDFHKNFTLLKILTEEPKGSFDSTEEPSD